MAVEGSLFLHLLDLPSLPESALKKFLKRCFAPLQDAQKQYERCSEVDDLNRRHFVSLLPSVPAPTEREASLLSTSLKYHTLADDTLYKRVRGSLKTYPTLQMFTRFEPSSDSLWGTSVGDIDETPERVLAWNWHMCSYERVQRHRGANGERLVRQTDAKDDSRTQVYQSEYKMIPTIANRSTTLTNSWFQLDPSVLGREAYAIAFATTQDHDDGKQQGSPHPFSKNAVKVNVAGIYLFERLAPRVTKFTMRQSVDLGGQVPLWLTNAMAAYILESALEVQNVFRRTDSVVDKVRLRSCLRRRRRRWSRHRRCRLCAHFTHLR